MKKYIIAFVIFIGIFSGAAQASNLSLEINTILSKSEVNRSAVSISIKDAQTGKVVYELHPKMPISPASTQKIITGTPAFMTLGEDYRFSTNLYKSNSGEYTLKLGADPYLQSKELDKIVKAIEKEPANIFIDDSILDDNEWGEGWQWDDDLNPLMPKFSAYNLDKNLMEIIISPSTIGYPAEIRKETNYPVSFVNRIVTDKKTRYTLKRQNYISPDIIIAEGTIKYNKSEIFSIPINNPSKYFKMRLSELIIDHNISSSGVFNKRAVNKNDKLITTLSHDISRAKKDIFKHSNNYVSETVFKLAGGKYTNSTGSFENGLMMFNNFCKKHHLDTSNIRIVDASGVSKNNLMIADFMTDFLICTQGFLEPELPTAGEGTLSSRMLYLKDYVHAKTGTLNNISAIAGYLTSQSDCKYVFCIMINDSKTTASDKKVLEEYILRTLYTKG